MKAIKNNCRHDNLEVQEGSFVADGIYKAPVECRDCKYVLFICVKDKSQIQSINLSECFNHYLSYF